MMRLILVGCMALLGAFASAKPLKVFVLVGQSNMQGHAKISSFDHIGMDPKSAPMLAEMRGEDGAPRVLDDVWISYRTGKAGDAPVVGKLTAGFGARRNPVKSDDKIGPEFTFGIFMHKKLQEPVLIIKVAWGGKSLHTDFRPPSAGAFEFNDEELVRLKKNGKDVDAIRAEKVQATGLYYRFMMEHIKSVLADPGKVHPGYDAKEGYELAGFVWFQGWNDLVAGNVYPNRGGDGGYAKYSEMMAHFIRDVRKDLEQAKLPFVIGVLGVGGPTDQYGESQQRYLKSHDNFRMAMAAPALMPEFKGNVTAVLTEKFWDAELEAVGKKRHQLSIKEEELRQSGLAKKELSEAMLKLRAEMLTERDEQLLKGITNAAYHYLGSAKIMGKIGEGFADACYKLQK